MGYIISTWHFECAHGPVGDSSTRGIPAERGQGGGDTSQWNSGTNSTKSIPSVVLGCLLSFLSSQSQRSLSRTQGVAEDSAAPPSPAGQSLTFSLSTCSARETCHCGCHLHCNSLGVAFPRIQSAHFRIHRWMHLSGVLVCVQRHFCYRCLISCRLKGREKRNTS